VGAAAANTQRRGWMRTRHGVPARSNIAYCELADAPGIGHQMARRLRRRKRVQVSRERQRQQKLIGKMEPNCAVRGVM